MEEGLPASVRRWLERDEVDARITVVVDGRAEGEIVVVVYRDGAIGGERRLQTSGLSCARVNAMVSLAVAMAIDTTSLELSQEQAPARQAPDAPGPPVPEVPPAPPVSPGPSMATRRAPAGTSGGERAPSERRERPRHRTRVGLEERVWLEVLPRLGVGVGPYVIVERGAVRVRAAAAFTLPVEIGFQEPVGTSARLFLAVAEADVCALLRFGQLGVGPCAGFGAGLWSGSGRGFPRADSTTVPWAFLSGGATVTWNLTPEWALDTHAGLLLALVRPALTVGRAGGRFERTVVAPAVGASLGLGLSRLF